MSDCCGEASDWRTYTISFSVGLGLSILVNIFLLVVLSSQSKNSRDLLRRYRSLARGSNVGPLAKANSTHPDTDNAYTLDQLRTPEPDQLSTQCDGQTVTDPGEVHCYSEDAEGMRLRKPVDEHGYLEVLQHILPQEGTVFYENPTTALETGASEDSSKPEASTGKSEELEMTYERLEAGSNQGNTYITLTSSSTAANAFSNVRSTQEDPQIYLDLTAISEKEASVQPSDSSTEQARCYEALDPARMASATYQSLDFAPNSGPEEQAQQGGNVRVGTVPVNTHQSLTSELAAAEGITEASRTREQPQHYEGLSAESKTDSTYQPLAKLAHGHEYISVASRWLSRKRTN